jgi:hypothetical protein
MCTSGCLETLACPASKATFAHLRFLLDSGLAIYTHQGIRKFQPEVVGIYRKNSRKNFHESAAQGEYVAGAA